VPSVEENNIDRIVRTSIFITRRIALIEKDICATFE